MSKSKRLILRPSGFKVRYLEGMQESRKDFRPTRSPLEIPHILERITSYLGMQDLRSFRLVNRSLSEELLIIGKNRRSIWISDSDSKDVEDLIRKKLSGSNVQVSRVSLSTSKPLHSNKPFKTILNLFGLTLRRLQITDYSNDQITSSMFFKVMTDVAPNLEEISVHIRPSDISAFQNQRKKSSLLTELRAQHTKCSFPLVLSLEWDEGCTVDLLDVSYLFPNVRKLEISKLSFSNKNKKVSARKNAWKSLKTLNLLYLNVTPTVFKFFESLQLKLETFVLSQSSTSEGASQSASLALTSFLASVSSTLRELRVTPTCGLLTVSCHLKVVLPLLPELTRLDIMYQTYNSFNILKQTPQLQKFISGFHNPNVSQLEATHHSLIKSSNVEYASFGAADFYFIEKFSAVCSRLTELWVHPSHIDVRAFRAIIVGFPYLRRLSICDLWGAGTFFSGRMADNNSIIFNDSAVTGIPEKDLAKLTNESTDEEVEKLRTFPFIGNLKYLEELSLEGRSSPLTDKSFTFGVKFLPNITNITLRNAMITRQTFISVLTHNEKLKNMTANGCPLLKDRQPISGIPEKWIPADKWHLSSVCITVDAIFNYFTRATAPPLPKKRRNRGFALSGPCNKRSRISRISRK